MQSSLSWVSAGGGYEIAWDGSMVLCRNGSGGVAPIPDEVAGTRMYPAWALLHHPDDAVAALAADAEMTRSATQNTFRRAAAYDRIAADLPVRHWPVFFEHAARALAGAGDTKRAAAMFERARTAESEHNLPVDDAAWLGALEEFATLGAVSAKLAAEFAKELQGRFTPDTALDWLIRLAVLRARAGQAPWPRLPKQVSKLALQAGRDEEAEHRRLLEQVLTTEGIRASAMAMWRAWRPNLVRTARSSGAIRSLLLNLHPYPEDIDGWWLELLDDCGALELMSDSAAMPGGVRATWLERTIWHPNMDDTLRRRSHVSRPVPHQVLHLIVRMRAALVADRVALRLAGPDYWTRRVNVSILETCLAHGVPVSDLESNDALGLDEWLRHRGPDDDLSMTVADPRFGPIVREWAIRRGRDTIWTVPALRAFFEPPAATEPPPSHHLDGPRIHIAVSEFGSLSGYSMTDHMPLHNIELVSALLRGHATVADNRRGISIPEELIGRIGWVALRAVAASTPPDRRELLLAFLEVWADSAFADPAVRLRRGTVHAHRRHIANECGAAFVTTWFGQDPRRFLDIRTGPAEPPAPGVIVEATEIPVGWGTADRLRALVTLVRERGAAPHDRAAAKVLAERTGMSRPAATSALAGLLGVHSYSRPFTSSRERKILGLKVSECDQALHELAWISAEQRLDMLAGVLPDDPVQLWEPDGFVTVAERMSGAWAAMVVPG